MKFLRSKFFESCKNSYVKPSLREQYLTGVLLKFSSSHFCNSEQRMGNDPWAYGLLSEYACTRLKGGWHHSANKYSFYTRIAIKWQTICTHNRPKLNWGQLDLVF